jgi:hypothetical protein
MVGWKCNQETRGYRAMQRKGVFKVFDSENNISLFDFFL